MTKIHIFFQAVVKKRINVNFIHKLVEGDLVLEDSKMIEDYFFFSFYKDLYNLDSSASMNHLITSCITVEKWVLSLTQPHKTGLWEWGLHSLTSRRGYQLVRGDIYYGWFDNGPIGGGLIITRICSKWLWYHVKKWVLSLTQHHKTGSWEWGLHPLIYYEMSLSLVDVGFPTIPHLVTNDDCRQLLSCPSNK